MNWIDLKNNGQIKEIIEKSKARPQIIFKHSSRCSISSMAKGRLERSLAPDNADFYFLDLIAYRSVSNQVSAEFKVSHESPQILVIKNGQSIYDESHGYITMDEIEEQISVV